MNVLRRDDIEKLMGSYEEPCVSVFMPTHRGASESRQDQNRFKELVVVTDRFHVKPLLPLLSGDKQFYLLALSQNQVRLFQGSRYSVIKIDLEGVPDSLAEAVGYDEREKQLQSHTRSPGSGGGRGAIFHGHGEGTDDAKDRILEYFRQIDKGLQQLLKDENAPLLLAFVEYLFPICREASTYPHLVNDGVTGNPEGLSAEDLHEQAWAIASPLFNKAEKDAVKKYRGFTGTGKTSRNVRKIVPAAYHGRVESLLERKVDKTVINYVIRFKTLVIFLTFGLIYASMIPGLKGLMGTMMAGAGVTAIVVGFAAKSTLANLISGLSLAVYRPFRIGDKVSLDNEYGTVEDITLRHTIVRAWRHRRLIIPNEKIDNNMSLINYSIVDPLMLCTIELSITQQPPSKDGGLKLRTESPDTGHTDPS